VARAETVVGDRWTVLILRELFIRMQRFVGEQTPKYRKEREGRAVAFKANRQASRPECALPRDGRTFNLSLDVGAQRKLNWTASMR
jgi:hypothetical protein